MSLCSLNEWVALMEIIVQLLSHVWLFVTPWTAACQSSLSFNISWNLLRFMAIESVMLSNHTILYCPLFLLPSVFPSIRVFSNESAVCIRLPKYWTSASVLPMNVQGWFPLGLTGFILLSKGFSRVFSSTTVLEHQFLGVQPSLWPSYTSGFFFFLIFFPSRR